MLDCNIYGEYNSRKVKDSFRFNSFDVFESFEGEAFAVTLLVVLLEVFLRRNLSMIKAPKSRHDRGTLIRTDYIRKKGILSFRIGSGGPGRTGEVSR